MDVAITQNRHSTAVIVFVKAPRAGSVKTRLARTLGNDAALGLYRRFVADILGTLGGMLGKTGIHLRIGFDPPGAGQEIAGWLGSRYFLFAQRGETLGEKIHHALVSAFDAGVEKAVLIGTDIPHLSRDTIEAALDALEENDAVIGPASDGGYYLIGFDAGGYCPAVFDNIPWSTGRVFGETMERFTSCGIRPHELPVYSDIDTFGDLVEFAGNVCNNPEAASNTMAYITENALLTGLLKNAGNKAVPQNGNTQ